MTVDAELVESLLYGEEGDALDFKREQYPFAKVTDLVKTKLLKDILAFANSWRRADAYILTGVEEVKGGRSIVLGIQEDLDDADLQQFVNQKTQRPIAFSYRAVPIDGKRVGLFHIPLQQRPFYLKKDYASLTKDTVYVRRGSSTDIAKPDEVFRMGASPSIETREPKITFSFADPKTRQQFGLDLQFKVVTLSLLEGTRIRDYGHSVGHFYGDNNKEYYRQTLNYHVARQCVQGFLMTAANDGDVLAQNVKILLTMDDSTKQLIFATDDQLPQEPSQSNITALTAMRERIHMASDPTVQVQQHGTTWHITVTFPRIAPKDTAWTEDLLYIGARNSGTGTIDGKIIADNISNPPTFQVNVAIIVAQITINGDDFPPKQLPAEKKEKPGT